MAKKADCRTRSLKIGIADARGAKRPQIWQSKYIHYGAAADCDLSAAAPRC
jgi:hypothetical protein